VKDYTEPWQFAPSDVGYPMLASVRLGYRNEPAKHQLHRSGIDGSDLRTIERVKRRIRRRVIASGAELGNN